MCICTEYRTSPCSSLKVCWRTSSCFQLTPCLKGNTLPDPLSSLGKSSFPRKPVFIWSSAQSFGISAQVRGPQLHAAICSHANLWSLKLSLLEQEQHGSKKRHHLPQPGADASPTSHPIATRANELSLKSASQQPSKVTDPNKVEAKNTVVHFSPEHRHSFWN